ncbi:MAG: recombinase family protein [Ktedonobacteraceae bacterium]
MNAEILHVTPTTAHRAKMAYVYIRQSSLMQVTRHAESTGLQYSLVERAIALGWPRERVEIIDEDLGKSGAQAEARGGFQRLLAEISLARAGLVLSFDASRLARNNRDWYQLLEVCSIFGTLIADGERLYDPRLYHDRLLLGLSGMMSEAELHHIKQRMHAGARHKAERGELRLGLPVGLARGSCGEVMLNPDEEVQARIPLVFQKFRDIRSARGVMCYLRETHLPLPVRPLRGPAPHEVVWQEARASSVRDILQNPAYAGAYVYGRKVLDPTRRRPDAPSSGPVRQPIDKWEICLHNVYPAYIAWDEFLANQAQLRSNQLNYREELHGVRGLGQALLQGIVRCGYCGAFLHLRSSGPQGDFPVYVCNNDQRQLGGKRCQEVRAIALDAQVEHRFLEALRPDQVALALAALAQLEQEERAERKQWELRLERARYEAKRAERQYQTVEPENRLVARSLERQWEEKLRAVEAVEKEYQAWSYHRRIGVTDADRETILALGSDLAVLWQAETTTNAERKQMLRLVIRDVIVDGKRAHGQVWVQINWQTGAHEEFCYKRSVRSYEASADVEALEQRVRKLNAASLIDAQIAAVLNAEGYRTARLHRPFTGAMVWLLREKWDIPTVKINGKEHNPAQWEDGSYSVQGAAARLGVFPGTIHHWLKVGKLTGYQLAKGMPWKVYLTEEDMTRLQEWLRRARRLRRKAL